jgi:hypothetical protein
MYAVCYEVYHHPPFLRIGLHSIGCKCKLINFMYDVINFNQYNLRGYSICNFVATYCFVSPFRKAKFCGVPSRAIGCAVDKKRLRCTNAQTRRGHWSLGTKLKAGTHHGTGHGQVSWQDKSRTRTHFGNIRTVRSGPGQSVKVFNLAAVCE